MTQELKIGLLGLGTVGGGIPLILSLTKDKILKSTGVSIVIEKAFVRNKATKQKIANQYGIELTTEITDILTDKTIDIVVEVIGGVTLAKEFIELAIKNKKHVVTANKDLIAQFGEELTELAQENNVYLYYEAAVAGGIPILRTLANSFMSDDISNIQGIVNGTTNFMLTQMAQKNWSYVEALEEAQKRGFAESDPTNDVEGIDAAYKMIILTRLAYGMSLSLNEVQVEGITQISTTDMKLAKELGYTIKLVGSAKKQGGKISVDVSPSLLSNSHALRVIDNETNGILITSLGIGETLLTGPGAGARPTATSIVSDIVTIGKNLLLEAEATPFFDYKIEKKLCQHTDIFSKKMLLIECGHTEKKQQEVFDILFNQNVEIENIVKEINDDKVVIAVITNRLSESDYEAIEAALVNNEISLLSQMKVL